MNFPDNINYELIEPYLDRIVLNKEIEDKLCLCPCIVGEPTLFPECVGCVFTDHPTMTRGTCGLYSPNNPNLQLLNDEIVTKHPELVI